jgi:hypothetical protein
VPAAVQPLALALEAEHPLHLGDGQLVDRVVAVGLAVGVVGPAVVALLGERAPLLHELLRGVEERAPVVELELHLRGVGGDGEGELLRRALPLLRLLVLDAALEVLLALLRQHRDGRGQQADDDEERRERARGNRMLHLEPQDRKSVV